MKFLNRCKKIFAGVMIIVIAAVVAFNADVSLSNDIYQMDLMLANIQVLAQNESGGGSKSCYASWNECSWWEDIWNDCYSTTPCHDCNSTVYVKWDTFPGTCVY